MKIAVSGKGGVGKSSISSNLAVSLAKKGSLTARRQVMAFLPDKKAVHKLFDPIDMLAIHQLMKTLDVSRLLTHLLLGAVPFVVCN